MLFSEAASNGMVSTLSSTDNSWDINSEAISSAIVVHLLHNSSYNLKTEKKKQKIKTISFNYEFIQWLDLHKIEKRLDAITCVKSAYADDFLSFLDVFLLDLLFLTRFLSCSTTVEFLQNPSIILVKTLAVSITSSKNALQSINQLIN